MSLGGTDEAAKLAYQAFAPAYDDFTHVYQNESWTGELLAKAEAAGLVGRCLLDVGCGTGKSFIPMLDRGWEVTGCDISPAMIALARGKVEDSVDLSVADMRQLPVLGSFDLVWALDDVANYLLSQGELEAALLGMRRNLASTGLLMFDLNTLAGLRGGFADGAVLKRQGGRLIWRGQTRADAPEGSVFEARLEARHGEEMKPHLHRQRHFPVEEVSAVLKRAGLSCRGVFGEDNGILQPTLDEEVHTKAVYLASSDTVTAAKT